MRTLFNLLGYQAVWFANVIGAVRGHVMFGLAVSLAFIAVQATSSRHRRSDARLVPVALVMGFVIDGGLSWLGWIEYASASPGYMAPIWILAIWAAFAMTINHSLAFLHGRPLVAALTGAIGAPLAYLGAARGFNAANFVEPQWHGVVALAASWALALPALHRVARLERRTPLSASSALQERRA